jgi:hypothetical protein
MTQQRLEQTPSSTDVMAIYDQKYTQLFQQARIMEISVACPSKVMDHPIESGYETSDAIIMQPEKLEIKMILTGSVLTDVYENIRKAHRTGQFLFITTRATSYENHIIDDYNHVETTQIFDGIAITLKTRGVIIVTAQVSQRVNNPIKKADTKTQDRSTIQPTPVDTKKPPASSSLSNAASWDRVKYF